MDYYLRISLYFKGPKAYGIETEITLIVEGLGYTIQEVDYLVEVERL